MKKKLVSVLSSAALLATLAGTTMAAPSFSDVPANNPYVSYIQDLSSKGIVSGVGNGQFAPTKTLTRAEMATFLVRAFGISQNTSTSVAFTDISGHWAESYIKSAYAAGMIAGKSATTFAPDATVTRQEAAQMVWNYLSKQGISPQTVAVSGKADAWAQTAVANVLGRKLYGPTAFSDWTAPMNRQEAAALIDLAMQALAQKSHPSPVPPVSSGSSSGTSSSSGSSGMLPASADYLKVNSDGTMSPANVTIPPAYLQVPGGYPESLQSEIKNLMAQVKFQVSGSSVTVTLPDTGDSNVSWYTVALLNTNKLSKGYLNTQGTTLTFDNASMVRVDLRESPSVGSAGCLTALLKNVNGQWELQYK